MFNRDTAATALTLLGVVLLVVSASAGALAAAPTVDQETTNSATQSDVTDGSTVTNFEAAASNYTAVEADFDSDNPAIKVIDPETNETIKSWGPNSLNETNASQDVYRKNISHESLQFVPMDSGENKSVTFRFVNNTNVDSPDMTNITVYFENVAGRTVLRAGDTAAENEDLTFSSDGTFSLAGYSQTIGLFANDKSTVEYSDVAINGSGSTATVKFANTTAQTRFSDVLGDKEAGSLSLNHQTKVDGSWVNTYADEAPDSVDNDTTYAVYDSSTDAVTVHFGDDYDGETSADVMVRASSDTGDKIAAYGVLETFGLEWLNPLSVSGGSGLTGVLFLFGGRKLGGKEEE